MAASTPSRSAVAVALGALAGVWEGTGHGEFPTIESFDYRERAEFVFDEVRGLVRYSFEDTIVGPDGEDIRPSHVDVGVLRVTDEGTLELLSAQNGRVEVLRGSVPTERIGNAIEMRLESVAIGHDPRVASSARLYRVDSDSLYYEIWMELATLEGSRIHTHATLSRR